MIDKNFEASASNVELGPFAMEKMGVEKRKKKFISKTLFYSLSNKVRKFHLKRFPSQFMLANKNISLNYACYELAYCPLFVGIFHVPFSIGDI